MDKDFGKRPLRHYSFILSLWPEKRTHSHAPTVWRYTLEDPHMAVRRGFKDPQELAQFLQEWTARPLEDLPIDQIEESQE